MVTYLTSDQIIRLNKRTAEVHGGSFVPPHNLLHQDSLLYIIEAVEAEMFGQQMYQTVPDKAALYMHSIISNHVFQDGNKRTGLGAALAFCEINDWNVNSNELYDFTIAVASAEHDLVTVRAWFTTHASKR
jgi:death-on-curing protein